MSGKDFQRGQFIPLALGFSLDPAFRPIDNVEIREMVNKPEPGQKNRKQRRREAALKKATK